MLVSVCCLSYNHEKFIKYALDGILKQKVNFDYEILIHDDASTDKSQEIIREYEKKYPDIIKPIYQVENKYTKGEQICPYNFNRAKGKYLAFCECDDYWIDENKLQKQINFLENNIEYMGTTHNIYVVDKYNNIQNLNNEIRPSLEEHDITTLNELKYNQGICGQTATIVCRNFWSLLSEEQKKIYCESETNGDRKISICLVNFGKIKYFSEVMSAYRITYDTDSWTSRNAHKITALSTYKNEKKLQEFALKAFQKKMKICYEDIVADSFIKFMIKPSKINLIIITQIISKIESAKVVTILKSMIQIIERILIKLKLRKRQYYWATIPKVTIKEKE